MAIEHEQVVAQTAFGSVTDRRIRYLAGRGWFGGGSEEDLPLRHVTSVRLETTRYIVWGLLLALGGLAALAGVSDSPALILVSLAMFAFAALLLWGSPRVVVNTAGGDLRRSSGFPWVKADADQFVRGVREQLFKD